MKFKARTQAPTKGNKYYTRKDSGGYSNAVKGKPTQDCDALSNCVGYSYGRIAEASGRKANDLCEPTNPGYFDKYLYNGCTKGNTPKEGAIIVWTKDGGKESEGHVGNVEAVIDSDTIVCSESHYGGAAFDLNIHGLKDGKKFYKSGYTFKCFVYSSYIETKDDEINDLKYQLAEYQVDYDGKCKEIKEITAELDTSKQRVANLTSELNEAKKCLKTSETKAQMLETSYNKVCAENGEIKSQLDLFKKSCEVYEAKLEELDADRTKYSTLIEDLQYNVNEYLGEIADLKETNEAYLAEIEGQNKIINDVSHRLQERDTEIENLKAGKCDINGDGKVDLSDVIALFKIIIKK